MQWLTEAPLPPDEQERLAELITLGVLDTPPEECFDRVTRMAAIVLQVPIALISLVDADRQWFKSCVGLDVRQTSRGVSFCAHALSSDEPLVVPDSRADPRFRDNPLVLGPPNIRFYAGRPVHGPSGRRIGTFCVIDTKPRELNAHQLEMLDHLAAWAERELNVIELSKALDAQMRSERRKREVMRSVGDAILLFDAAGVIREANSAGERLFGVSEGGLIGRNVTDLVAGPDRDAVARRLDERRQGEVNEVRLAVTAVRADGSIFPMEVVVNDLEGSDGATLIVVGRDATAQVRAASELAAAQRRLRAILDAAGEGIAGVDAEGRITFVNEAGASMFGTTPSDLIGRPFSALTEGVEGSRLEPAPMRTSEDDTDHHLVDEVFRRADGTTFPVEYRTGPLVEDSVIVGAVVTFADITERREVERLKDEFISVVSHELRTPLTSIRGSLGLLASGALGELPERGAHMLQIAASNTDRLVRLVNDILDLERIGSGRTVMDIRDADARAIAASAVDAVRGEAERAGISLEIDVPAVTIPADSDRIVQVLVNLLGNAVKFSPSGEKVVLRGIADEHRLHLEVIDRGRGIPADRLERIFERFEQVDASDARQKGGTGLGLAIARSIIDLHGGSIWAESVDGVGATFHVAVPVTDEAGSEDGATGAAGCVLVVEDDADLAHVLTAVFEQRGFQVRRAAGERDAVAQLRENLPDAVVLDVQLAEGDAYGVLDALRRHPRGHRVPVAVFTVHELSRADRARLRQGPVIILTKSKASPEELGDRLAEMTRRR